MSEPVLIWVEVSHHEAFRCGGWAFVRRADGALEGVAGGDRATSAERTALNGVVQALTGLPAGVAARVMSASPLVLGLPRRIAGFEGGDGPPAEALELWAQLAAALKARSVSFAASKAEARTPTAFAAAWAELARDKAKATGPFRAPIPKPNLAKAGA